MRLGRNRSRQALRSPLLLLGCLFVAFPVGTALGADLVFEGGGEQMIVPSETLLGLERDKADHGLNRVTFQLDKTDAAAFAEMTRRLEGQTLTISACGVILASPMVMVPIEYGTIVITGGTDAGTDALFDALESHAPCPEGTGS